MKRLLCLSLALIIILALVACGSKKTDGEPTTQPTESTQATVKQTEKPAETNAETLAQDNTAAVQEAVLGKLISYTEKEGDGEPIITGLRLTGNRAGTGEGINGKKPSTDNIRSVFELNEWIEIYPETKVQTGLAAVVVPHSDDPEAYKNSVKTPEDAPSVKLEKPEEDGYLWGSLYLNPEDWPAGLYDLVITADHKPVASVVIRLYAERELDGKTDAELEQLMNNAG